ncbi:MerR family transcriptional regulator [Photobacterium sp. TY1-4]|uniref:MerR family transcriptional regulator n=1 Tax=Photobacterium sp. TY1-4 TaxID=2899122 RepID=UPI0021C223AD|nr:MerR family transcriptional regulator [Photobacterium sp. TY1-4]UXI02620.1 MerR family transcriptional regulator [Photobacterium sp. TY1-4]
MYIGAVAKQTGLSVKAIRLYEQKGLIQPPARHGRYRVYRAQEVEALKLIVEAKSLGVTLARLKDVIVYQNGELDWQRIGLFLAEVKQSLEQEKQALEAKIAQADLCLQSLNACPKMLDSAL